MAEAGDLIWAARQHLPRMVIPRTMSGPGDPHDQRLLDLPATLLLGQQVEPACPAKIAAAISHEYQGLVLVRTKANARKADDPTCLRIPVLEPDPNRSPSTKDLLKLLFGHQGIDQLYV